MKQDRLNCPHVLTYEHQSSSAIISSEQGGEIAAGQPELFHEKPEDSYNIKSFSLSHSASRQPNAV
jgi:hypothetical protein